MEIQIIHPTLDEYFSKVNSMAAKYEQDSWLELVHNPDVMTDGDDRDEFAFIVSALGDQLISREIQVLTETADIPNNVNDGIYAQPGLLPGCALLAGVSLGCPNVCRLN